MRYAIAAVCAVLAYLFLSPVYLFPDGQGYFSYLPSLFFDGDLQLYNNFVDMRIPVPLALTPTGYISNNWSFGAAFFWAPFYLLAKVLADVASPPHSPWFWHWVNFASMVYGIGALLLLAAMLKKLGHTGAAASTAGVLAFAGTPALFYTFAIPSTAHAPSAFAATAFFWYWLVSFDDPRPWQRYALLGVLLAFAAMARPQEAVFGVVVPVELLLRKGRLPPKKILAAFALGLIAGASPQLLVWEFVNGSFFAAPAKFNLSLGYFAPLKVLFSPYHGILWWTPVMFVAAAGLIAGMFRRPLVYGALLLAFLAQLFINSISLAFWEGYSFGLRQMTSSLPLVAAGIAAFVRCFEGRGRAVRAAGWAVVILPVLWTGGLFCNYYLGLSLLEYVAPGDVLAAQMKLLPRLPELFGKIAAINRPAFPAFAAMTLAGAALLLALRSLKEAMEKKRTAGVLAALFVVVAAADVLVIRAHLNKPPRRFPPDAVTTQEKLDEFFINQVKDIKKKYGL